MSTSPTSGWPSSARVQAPFKSCLRLRRSWQSSACFSERPRGSYQSSTSSTRRARNGLHAAFRFFYGSHASSNTGSASSWGRSSFSIRSFCLASGGGCRCGTCAAKSKTPSSELRARLTPDFQFGCKRVLLSDDYWAAFERDNVELVTERIEAIRSEGIETADGKLHVFDAIVLATGFLLGLATTPFRVRGRGGRTLDEAWTEGAVAYKGMTVSGFPNWFMMMGPNTGPGHTSVLVFTEAQIEHALQAIKKMMAEDIKYCDVRQEVQDRYNQGIQKRMKHMVWASGCQSWYLSNDGENHSLYPGFASEYVLRARHLNPNDYEVAFFEKQRENEARDRDSLVEGVSATP